MLYPETQDATIRRHRCDEPTVTQDSIPAPFLFTNIRDLHGGLIVAGDFNAKGLEWGETRTDARGKRVLERSYLS